MTSLASSIQIFLVSAQPHASCAIFNIKVSLGWFLPKRVGRIVDYIPIKGPAERANLILEDDKVKSLVLQFIWIYSIQQTLINNIVHDCVCDCSSPKRLEEEVSCFLLLFLIGPTVLLNLGPLIIPSSLYCATRNIL